MVDKQVRGKYTLEYKLEAVRQVKAGQSAAVAASQKAPVVTAEQMELARLRAENTWLKMERDIAKKAAAYFPVDPSNLQHRIAAAQINCEHAEFHQRYSRTLDAVMLEHRH